MSDPFRLELSQISGGLAFLVKDVLGRRLGTFLLVEVVFAIFVCALAVQAGSVRLVFAMARDNNLPFAHALSHVATRTRAPITPSVVVGLLAATILILNISTPHVIETLCAVAIVWANLAYLLVTVPLLVARLRSRGRRQSGGRTLDASHNRDGSPTERKHHLFTLGIFGLPINVAAVLWGLFVVINVGWPRTDIYGAGNWGRFSAPIATLILVASGSLYFLLLQRHRSGVLREHAADKHLADRAVNAGDRSIEPRWTVQLATGDS